jgi:hypothetical protein
MKFCVKLIPILNIRENLFAFFYFFLLALKPNADETAQKTKNIFYKYVLVFNLTIINGLGSFILSKKVKIVVP